MQNKAAICFDTRKIIQKGENKDKYHLKILVTIYDRDGERTRRYYKTGVFADGEGYARIMSGKFGKGNESLSDARRDLLALEKKALDAVGPATTFEEFEREFLGIGSKVSPLEMLLKYAGELESDGQIGTARFYKNAHSAFNKFSGGFLTFHQVTPKWLRRFEKWFLEQKDENGNLKELSIATVGTHTRNLRTIFNQAITAKIIPADLYPFRRNPSEKDKYQCPESKGRKIALDEIQKNKVLEYKGQHQQAVDFWVLSYFCSGMNFLDIARLRRKDIEDNVITFKRGKTLRTSRKQSSVVVAARPEVMAIIHKHGNKTIAPNDYVFPILRPGLTAKQERNMVVDWINATNDELEKACKEMKIPRITTYWARHTFATIAKRKGASIEMIQEALGHADARTTRGYMDSFDIETKKRISEML
jgi:integrase/recombinase XerD